MHRSQPPDKYWPVPYLQVYSLYERYFKFSWSDGFLPIKYQTSMCCYFNISNKSQKYSDFTAHQFGARGFLGEGGIIRFTFKGPVGPLSIMFDKY